MQENALQAYAQRNGGQIVRMWRIAETASKTDQRTAFKELLAYAKADAAKLDGLPCYKVDRAARNLFDYVELERLESEHGIPFISVSQPMEHTPAGRMQRRMLTSMASFYTEQQSVDVREGLAKRVQAGLFVGHAPYGYRNVRIDGRSVIEIDEQRAQNVRSVFNLYGYQNHTLDMIVARLAREGVNYTDAQPQWPRSKVHKILRDRAYIGEVFYQGRWHPSGAFFREEPHLAHLDLAELDEVNAMLAAHNAGLGRKPVNGQDPRQRVAKKRTRWPGQQHQACWYCGGNCIWGGNCMNGNLTCNRSREWRCWNSIGFNGELLASRTTEVITAKLYELERFDQQFRHMVAQAGQDATGELAREWAQLERRAQELAVQKENVKASMKEFGAVPLTTLPLGRAKARSNMFTSCGVRASSGSECGGGVIW